MFFMSYAFAAAQYTLDTAPPKQQDIQTVTISNGAFDELNMTRNAETTFTPGNIDPLWYFGTVFHAFFNGDLVAGNVNFSIENTDFLRIKRRMENSFSWISMYDIPIYDASSLEFERFDMTVRGNTEYEYALVPVSGNIEGGYIINNLRTSFCGLFIVERNKFYSTCMNVEWNEQQQNKPVNTVAPLGRRYPFVISNGDSNFKTGSTAALFLEKNEINGYELKKSWQLRSELNDFLFNGLAKLFKRDTGEMYLASVSSGQVSESGMNHEHLVKTSLNWTEVADCDEGSDLFKYGFIDVRNGVRDMSGVSITEDRLNRLEFDVRRLRETKADDIIMRPDTGGIQLTAEEKPIGAGIDPTATYGAYVIYPT